MAPIHPGLFINGTWITSDKLPNFSSLNPFNGKVVGMVPETSSQLLDDAVQAAHKALGVWGRLPGQERAQYLLNTAKKFEEHQSEIVELLVAETGSAFAKVLRGVQTLLQSFTYSCLRLRLCLSWTFVSSLLKQLVLTFGSATVKCFLQTMALWYVYYTRQPYYINVLHD